MIDARQRIEASSRLLAHAVASRGNLNGRTASSADSFESLLQWQLEHEKAVPTLCLTSPIDLVVPMTGVRAFAGALRAAQPTREIEVVEVRAPHCQLAATEPEAYSRGLTGWLERVDAARTVSDGGAPVGPPASAEVDVSDASVHPAAVSSVVGGGDTSAVDAPMRALLGSLGSLSLDADALAAQLSLAAAMRVLTEDGRPALLEALKQAGAAKLPERQKVANALSKRLREG